MKLKYVWFIIAFGVACGETVPSTDGEKKAPPPVETAVAPTPDSPTFEAKNPWQRPPKDILDVLHTPRLPRRWTSPTGDHILLADPVIYPSLADLAAPKHILAGIRVDPKRNYHLGRYGATSPRLIAVNSGKKTTLPLPDDAEVVSVFWTVDGTRFAMLVREADHMGVWVGSVDGDLLKINGIAVNALMGSGIYWLPDQQRLLVRRIPKRGPPPPPPAFPLGPEIKEAAGGKARSTYESRNLLKTAHDDALFTYYTTSELVIVDPRSGDVRPMGEPALYVSSEFSPDGSYLLIERLVGPWSHSVQYWRFAHEIEVWDKNARVIAKVASIPLADRVPIHGVPERPRGVTWRSTAPHTLFWVEALDGGDPVAEVPHRDRLMRLKAPFTGKSEEVFKAEHRIVSWRSGWGAEGGTLMLTQRERMRRWLYTWLLDVDNGTARPWFDRNQNDRYNAPGGPLHRPLPNGRWVLHQKGDAVYFAGSGATEEGDRPFLDLRHMNTEEVERLFRCPADRYENFIHFAGDESRFIIESQSSTDPPNFYLATLGDKIDAEKGEATRSHKRVAITKFEDPTPMLRQIEKRLVRYKRKDGVPLSFQLYLPPGYEEGTQLPTVLYAYPMEYSDPSTAGQVTGSTKMFSRFNGPTHLFFLLRGYAVLHRTAMPMIGDPETTYDTFMKQLVADAEAAVNKAVEIGVADPKRIGIIGHSHGGLMVANLLAHTDLFSAGIARSGSYNKTVQPYGFQNERRSLFQARDVYIQVSPTFFADKVNEPVLIIHGEADSNPGTRPAQSTVFYEAVEGAGGTARLVMLPFEDHGYRAKESVEHTLHEQLVWFDKYVKNAS